MKRILFSAVVIALAIMLTGCFGSVDATQGSQTNTTTTAGTTTKATTTEATTTAKQKLSYGDTVEVGNFEFTLVKTEVAKIDNQFSDKKEAVKLFVAIKNISDETKDIMLIYHPVFGPDGKEMEDIAISVYFNDKMDIMSKIRSGNTLEGYYVCEYAGDGEYIMEVYYLGEDAQEYYFEVKK